MAFKPYEEVADEPMRLPIKGKVYTLPEIGITDGARIEGREDIPDEELFRILFGDALDEMRADNIPADAFNRAFMVALADVQVGRAAAEAVWETGAIPERLAAKVEAANQSSTESPSSTSSASESEPETPSPASTSPTTSPTGTEPSDGTKPQPAKAQASRGSRSSASGASSSPTSPASTASASPIELQTSPAGASSSS